MTLPRIRQLVFASNDHADIERLRHILALGPGFVDPGVNVFGLTNGVFALGDQFLEVVVPTEADTAAGRFITRTGGVGGYMAIFQTDNLARVRAHADAEKIRRVWDIDVEDISATHFHPADIGAAIVSVDEARPASSWRWGGPDWQGAAQPGAIIGLDVMARDASALARRWGGLLESAPNHLGQDVWVLETQNGRIRVVPGDRDFLNTYTLAHPDPAGCLDRAREAGCHADETSFHFAGVQVSLLAN
ncbi:MAG: hypothetical protein ACX94B_01675 [Henriciella sp.]